MGIMTGWLYVRLSLLLKSFKTSGYVLQSLANGCIFFIWQMCFIIRSLLYVMAWLFCCKIIFCILAIELRKTFVVGSNWSHLLIDEIWCLFRGMEAKNVFSKMLCRLFFETHRNKSRRKGCRLSGAVGQKATSTTLQWRTYYS